MGLEDGIEKMVVDTGINFVGDIAEEKKLIKKDTVKAITKGNLEKVKDDNFILEMLANFLKIIPGIGPILAQLLTGKKSPEELSGFSEDIKSSIKNFTNFPEDKRKDLNFEFEPNFTDKKEQVEPLKKFLENFNRAKNGNKENEQIKIEDDKFWTNLLGNTPLENKFEESIRQKVTGIKKDGGGKLSQEDFFKKLSEITFEVEKKEEKPLEKTPTVTPVSGAIVDNQQVKTTAPNPAGEGNSVPVPAIGDKPQTSPRKPEEPNLPVSVVAEFLKNKKIEFKAEQKCIIIDGKILPIKFFKEGEDKTEYVKINYISLDKITCTYPNGALGFLSGYNITETFNINDAMKKEIITQLANGKAVISGLGDDKKTKVQIG